MWFTKKSAKGTPQFWSAVAVAGKPFLVEPMGDHQRYLPRSQMHRRRFWSCPWRPTPAVWLTPAVTVVESMSQMLCLPRYSLFGIFTYIWVISWGNCEYICHGLCLAQLLLSCGLHPSPSGQELNHQLTLVVAIVSGDSGNCFMLWYQLAVDQVTSFCQRSYHLLVISTSCWWLYGCALYLPAQNLMAQPNVCTSLVGSEPRYEAQPYHRIRFVGCRYQLG